MTRFRRMPAFVMLAVACLGAGLSSCGGSGNGNDADRAATAPRFTVGPIRASFDGTAYAVPVHPDPSHPNAVPVTVRNAAGDVVGHDFVASGTPHHVQARAGDEADEVEIDWDGGRTAVGSRADFWAMPSFVGLEHYTVPYDGTETAPAISGWYDAKAAAAAFDDRKTPPYDGIPLITRRFLSCGSDLWSIGDQTIAVDVVALGIQQDDRALIDKGVTGIDWGVAQPINANGVAELSRPCDGKTIADYGSTHHTTQWLESLSRSVYLLASSKYAGDYRDKIDAYTKRVNLIATRLSTPRNFAHWESKIDVDGKGHDFTHRTFMMAAAMGLASTLAEHRTDAARWQALAAKIVKRGIGNQWANGVNPERGGYDVQYQMYGTWLAELYRSTLQPGTAAARALDHTIARAIEWMQTRIDLQTGAIDITGSTRVCAETNQFSGARSARLDPRDTVRVFAYQGMTQSEPELTRLAILVERNHVRAGNPCPATSGPAPTS
jgi:hypothetical protein